MAETTKKSITLFKCAECGCLDYYFADGQYFCKDCGMEAPAPAEVDPDTKVTVWARIGFTIPLTIGELARLEEDDTVLQKIRQAIQDGTAYPDGDCYIPEEAFDGDGSIPEELKREYDFDL